MLKKVFLHIGTHKTGTTAIQDALARNRVLLRKHGILVPRTGCISRRSGHHNIAWELNGDPRFSEKNGTFDELIEEIQRSKQEVVIISSEDFEYIHGYDDTLALIKDRFASINCQVEIIVVVRKHGEYLRSLYLELLKHDVTLTWKNFKARAIEGRLVVKDRWIFNLSYTELVKPFKMTFGIAHVHIVNYTLPIEPVFFDLIGAKELDIEPKYLNVSGGLS